VTLGEDNTVSLAPPRVEVPDDPTGTTISRYVVLDTLGAGGMGRVLRAYDPKLQREVALKILRRHTLDAELQLQLLREVRALAKLSHPNVVAVYDVEETNVGAVIVMELVDGPTLRRWLRTAPRAWPEIVACFRLAGAGLAAAHAAGLLHRDFKPGNVLVAGGDVAKVTDFGLAKSMAPQQCAGGSLGPAVDQYAFCVALWEALCGVAPFVASEAPSLSAAKRETAPHWPDDAPPVPAPILDALRRGLKPQPEERWPTMDALVAALAHDPQRRRRRLWLAVALAGVGMLLGATALAWRDANRDQCSGAELQLGDAWDDERRQAVHAAMLATTASYAEPTWERVCARLDRYAEAWVAMHTDACAATAIRGEQSPQVLDLRMACLHRARLELRAVTQVLAGGDREVLPRADQLVADLRPLTRCAEVEALEVDVEPPLPEEEELVAEVRALLAEARAERNAGRYDAAKPMLEEARDQLVDAEYGPVRTELRLEEGLLLDRTGDYDAADTALQEALAGATVWGQRDEMLAATNGLIYVVGHRKRQPEAALRYRALAEALAEGDVNDEAAVAVQVAIVLAGTGANLEAEERFRHALKIRKKRLTTDDPRVAAAHDNLADMLGQLGRDAEAETEYRASLDIRERAFGPDHPEVATSLSNLSILLQRQGRLDEAETAARRAVTLYAAALGPEHGDVAQARTQLGTALLEQGKHGEAEAEYRAALAVWEAVHGTDRPEVGLAHLNLAGTLLTLDRHADAAREAEAAWAKNGSADTPPQRRATTAFVLAQASWAAGDPSARPRARQLAEQALDLYLAHDDPRADEVRRWLDAH
jgi:tetratricopeptide (TPR) repeat protein/tRNA A-37 threonylcarbamoyl transferase component Bud32